MSAETLSNAASSAAVLSNDGLYRYVLTRTWQPEVHRLWFIMLNPSTADATVDDPTIRRCMGFARRFGYGGVGVVNLYAYRATKPADLWKAADPVGPENDSTIGAMLVERSYFDVPTVAAWGANAKPERVAQVLAMPGAHRLMCLGLTKAGQPRHPLYLRSDAALIPFGGSS